MSTEHHFKIDDAIKYGVEAAVILYNIEYWIKKNEANEKHFHNGKYWTYNTAKAFAKLFPYLSEHQINRHLKKLENEGVLLIDNFNDVKYDRTNWFTLSDNYYMQNGNCKNAKCILQNCKMENAELQNGFHENATPIPYNKTNNNTDNNIIIGGAPKFLVKDKKSSLSSNNKSSVKKLLIKTFGVKFSEIEEQTNYMYKELGIPLSDIPSLFSEFADAKSITINEKNITNLFEAYYNNLTASNNNYTEDDSSKIKNLTHNIRREATKTENQYNYKEETLNAAKGFISASGGYLHTSHLRDLSFCFIEPKPIDEKLYLSYINKYMDELDKNDNEQTFSTIAKLTTSIFVRQLLRGVISPDTKAISTYDRFKKSLMDINTYISELNSPLDIIKTTMKDNDWDLKFLHARIRIIPIIKEKYPSATERKFGEIFSTFREKYKDTHNDIESLYKHLYNWFNKMDFNN